MSDQPGASSPDEAESSSGAGRRRGGRGRGRGRGRPLDAEATAEPGQAAELLADNLADADETTPGERPSRSRRRRQPRVEDTGLASDEAAAGGSETGGTEAEHDDRPAARPDGARRQPRRRRERRELPEQIALPTIPEVVPAETTPAPATDIPPLAGDVDWSTAEPAAPSAAIGTGAGLNVAPLFLSGDNAPAAADATPASELRDSAAEPPPATAATEMRTVTTQPETPEPAEMAEELAPAVPAEPQFAVAEAVVEEMPEVTAATAPAIGRADNDPRATPKPVTQLEVVSTSIEVQASGFIDTSRPAPVPRERVELPRPANDPRRGRATATSGQQGGEASG